MSVTLVSSDNEHIVADREVVQHANLVRNMLENVDDTNEAVIPLANVSGKILKKVMTFCEHHKQDPLMEPKKKNKEESKKEEKEEKEGEEDEDEEDLDLPYSGPIDDWDASFVAVEKDELFELVLAANYLEVKLLLDIGCREIAKRINGMSTDEISEYLGVENTFTPEEQENVRKEYAWYCD